MIPIIDEGCNYKKKKKATDEEEDKKKILNQGCNSKEDCGVTKKYK